MTHFQTRSLSLESSLLYLPKKSLVVTPSAIVGLNAFWNSLSLQEEGLIVLLFSIFCYNSEINCLTLLLRLHCYAEIRSFYKGIHLKKDAYHRLALVNMAFKSSSASETDWKLFSKYLSLTLCSNGHGTAIIMCRALVFSFK